MSLAVTIGHNLRHRSRVEQRQSPYVFVDVLKALKGRPPMRRVPFLLVGIAAVPTDDEWRQMANHYGGLLAESADGGKAAYRALVIGGTSGFSAILGGSRASDGRYERLDAHGIYWTASDDGSASAPFYNFGKGGQAVSRHGQGQKQMAVSVRCIKE